MADVLKAHPQLEERIIAVAPPFKNLRNPILRRTVAQLATIEQVAQIGGMDAAELVRILRRAAGLDERPAGPVQTFVPPRARPMTRNGSRARRRTWSMGSRCCGTAQCRCSGSTSSWRACPPAHSSC